MSRELHSAAALSLPFSLSILFYDSSHTHARANTQKHIHPAMHLNLSESKNTLDASTEALFDAFILASRSRNFIRNSVAYIYNVSSLLLESVEVS